MNLKEAVFDRTLPLDNVIYRLSYVSESELSPSTVTKENFSVYDITDYGNVEIEEVLYEPLLRKTTIVLNPQMVYNKYAIVSSDNVKSLSGESVATEYTADIKAGYDVEIGGASVLDISFYNGNKRISRPVGRMPLTIRITIANSSSHIQERDLFVYLNNDKEKPLISSKISIEAADTAEFVFGLLEREYSDNDVVNINLQ